MRNARQQQLEESFLTTKTHITKKNAVTKKSPREEKKCRIKLRELKLQQDVSNREQDGEKFGEINKTSCGDLDTRTREYDSGNTLLQPSVIHSTNDRVRSSLPRIRDSIMRTYNTPEHYASELVKYGVRKESIERTANQNWILLQQNEDMKRQREKRWNELLISDQKQGVITFRFHSLS